MASLCRNLSASDTAVIAPASVKAAGLSVKDT